MATTSAISIGLVGDYSPEVTAHRAIPMALELAGGELGVGVRYDWLHTTELSSNPDAALRRYQGIWCVPASPYANTDGAIGAIRFAREHGRAFLGTCGGFQHALMEYAQNALGMADPRHAEMDPKAADPLIAPLACSLVETSGTIFLAPQSRIVRAYGKAEIIEEYHCRYGLSQQFRSHFEKSDLRPVGWDAGGEVRAVELDSHPFYVATLFQHERAALRQKLPPLVREFVRASVGIDI
jgi:CTP synthase (UTP-ammonia lyase)